MPQVSHLPDAVFESRDMATFNRLFLRLPEIRLYTALLVAAATLALWLATNPWQIVLPILAVAIIYAPFEYVMHRWVLHNTHLCRTPFTAKAWWRLHYRHHSAPRDADVILGAPVSVMVGVGVGAVLGAAVYWTLATLAAATAASLLAAILYEYFHSLAHSRVELSSRYMQRMRRHHLTHHYTTDRGNFGIVTDVVDRLVGTVAAPGEDGGRSPTVYNLGYTDDVARQYPWVADMERHHAAMVRPDQPADGTAPGPGQP